MRAKHSGKSLAHSERLGNATGSDLLSPPVDAKASRTQPVENLAEALFSRSWATFRVRHHPVVQPYILETARYSTVYTGTLPRK